MITYLLSRDGPFCFQGRTYHLGDEIEPQTLPKALKRWEALGWIEQAPEAQDGGSSPVVEVTARPDVSDLAAILQPEPQIGELPEGHEDIKRALRGTYHDRLALVGDLGALSELEDRKDKTLVAYLTKTLVGGE